MNSSQQSPMIKFISIEGNIGAGKSTLFAKLKQYVLDNNLQQKVVFIDEPLEIWKGIIDPVTGKTILELFYENPFKWSFSFQTMVFASQQKYIRNTLNTHPDCRILISERSIEAGRNIFTKICLDSNYINTTEMQIYDLLFETNQYPLHMTIFLNTSANVCFERIQQRGRKGENEITMEYLTQCDTYYRKWLLDDAAAADDGNTPPAIVNVIDNNDLESVIPILMPYFIL